MRDLPRLEPVSGQVLATSGYTESALSGKVARPHGVRVLVALYSRKERAEALGATVSAA